MRYTVLPLIALLSTSTSLSDSSPVFLQPTNAGLTDWMRRGPKPAPQMASWSQRWSTFAEGMMIGAKTAEKTEMANKIQSTMQKAMEEEINYQLYHNWRLRLPEDSKVPINRIVESHGNIYIQNVLNDNIDHFELVANNDIKRLMQQMYNRWPGDQDPTPEQISTYMKEFTQFLDSSVNERQLATQTKNFIRQIFEENFNDKEYQVSVLDKLREWSPILQSLNELPLELNSVISMSAYDRKHTVPEDLLPPELRHQDSKIGLLVNLSDHFRTKDHCYNMPKELCKQQQKLGIEFLNLSDEPKRVKMPNDLMNPQPTFEVMLI